MSSKQDITILDLEQDVPDWARVMRALEPKEIPFRSSNLFSNGEIDQIQRKFEELKLAINEAQRIFTLGMPLTSAVQLFTVSVNADELKCFIYECIDL